MCVVCCGFVLCGGADDREERIVEEGKGENVAKGEESRGYGMDFGCARGGHVGEGNEQHVDSSGAPAFGVWCGVLSMQVWEDAEKMMRKVGRRVLKCGNRLPNDVIVGELGWMSMRGRRMLLRLSYWGKVLAMGGQR